MSSSPSIPDSLRVKRGQKVEHDHHNGLVKIAQQLTIQRGSLKGRQLPDGFMPRMKVEQSVSVDFPFRMSVDDQGEDGVTITFTPGYVEGVMPKIDDVELDDVDEKGNPPALTVKEKDWKAKGRVERVLVMLQYTLDANSNVTAVTPIVVSEKPAAVPKIFNKLVGFLIRYEGAVRPIQQMFFAQYFTAAGSQTPGAFKAYPRAGA